MLSSRTGRPQIHLRRAPLGTSSAKVASTGFPSTEAATTILFSSTISVTPSLPEPRGHRGHGARNRFSVSSVSLWSIPGFGPPELGLRNQKGAQGGSLNLFQSDASLRRKAPAILVFGNVVHP